MSITQLNNEDIIGIDVSKDKLDAYFSATGVFECWDNTLKGLNAAARLLTKSGFSGLVVIEATGGYERLCHEVLSKEGIAVHVAHPRRVHHFFQQKGYFAKRTGVKIRALRGHLGQIGKSFI